MNKNVGEPFKHITIGLQLGMTILLFVYGGYRLDLHLDMAPVFLMVGTVFGMGAGFYNLMKELNADTKKKEKNEKEEDNSKKVKWM